MNTAAHGPIPTPGTATEWRPAWYCSHAAYVLKWTRTRLAWTLTLHSQPIGETSGYPVGAPGLTSQDACQWADRLIGTAQDWIEQPRGSGAFHTHQDTA